MDVVVVESPAKASTINRYLGDDFHVLASYGHVRDLPPKDGSVRPDDDFAMSWQTDGRSDKHIADIIKALKGADRLVLATDPDREGEAISWHVLEELRRRGALAGKAVARVTFNEITRKAVLEAMAEPRDLDQRLIDAYLARRALDYLVGFTLSPVLWRKLPGSRSAGRVQSVALRLICTREAEIEAFKAREYWSVEATLATRSDETVAARLTHLNGKRLDRFDLDNSEAAEAAAAMVRGAALRTGEIETRQVRRTPQPPFSTSTLQQEASRKLGFSATHTMRVAQRLYEGVVVDGERTGLITYMRTDSITLSGDAVGQCRSLIASDFGKDYLPAVARAYRTKAKNAQEAHEAIRPADLRRKPGSVAGALDNDQRRLYDLIWRRTLASQMENAVFDQVSVDIAGGDGQVTLRATGQTLVFDGFLRLYEEGRDDTPAQGDGDDDGARLPKLTRGESLATREVTPTQHFTQPPPRFTEASLVRRMEELGIGRPSTYASIMQVLQDRDYVRLDRRRFVPEDRGRLVTAFLERFFQRYVQYDFTADLEEQLDDVSGGREDWQDVLRRFWEAFAQAVEQTSGLTITEVLDALDGDLGPHFFPADEEGTFNPRACPLCGGRLTLKLGRNGAFIGCEKYPECRHTEPLHVRRKDSATTEALPRELGKAESGAVIAVRRGPYGLYLQQGDAEDKASLKRVSLPKHLEPDQVTLEEAQALLALPRTLGAHPESGKAIDAGIGRFGPYIRHDGRYVSLKGDDDVLTIGINRAVDLLASAPAGRGQAAALRDLGGHPDDEKPVTIHKGRYGPYVKHGRTNATIPGDLDLDTLTMEQAVALLAARQARQGKTRSKVKAKGKVKAGPKAKAKAKSKTKAKSKAKPKTKAAVKATASAPGSAAPQQTRSGDASGGDPTPS
ncbi:MAG: type I DNA topoisomerase [Alphaproteobacteria bacterium]